MLPTASNPTSHPQPPYPGDLLPFKTEKVDAAVRYINEKTILSGIELARNVGDYVLKTFFDDDYAKFADPSRSKSTSFRALLSREDLLLGSSTIYNFIRISHQFKMLPAEVVTRLTLTQHRELLPLPDPERKEAMARRALEEGWSGAALRVQVRKLMPRSRRGRKPLPSFAKGIRGVAKALDLACEEEVTSDAVSKLGPERTSALRAQLGESLARMEALKDALEKVEESPRDTS